MEIRCDLDHFGPHLIAQIKRLVGPLLLYNGMRLKEVCHERFDRSPDNRDQVWTKESD